MSRTFWIGLGISVFGAASSFGAELKVGDAAPSFSVQTQSGAAFDLQSRKGVWTVLYFYPKASTPGCTAEACTFRDNLKKIRAQGADVFGVSVDSVADQARFHREQHLNFDLLADREGKVVDLYGARRPGMKVSKRWTFILDPALKIRLIVKDVDPVSDSVKVAEQIAQLKSAPAP